LRKVLRQAVDRALVLEPALAAVADRDVVAAEESPHNSSLPSMGMKMAL
jgi:hypothetical protein